MNQRWSFLAKALTATSALCSLASNAQQVILVEPGQGVVSSARVLSDACAIAEFSRQCILQVDPREAAFFCTAPASAADVVNRVTERVGTGGSGLPGRQNAARLSIQTCATLDLSALLARKTDVDKLATSAADAQVKLGTQALEIRALSAALVCSLNLVEDASSGKSIAPGAAAGCLSDIKKNLSAQK